MLASHVPASGQGGGMIRYVVEFMTAMTRRDDVELHVLCAPEAAPFFTELLGTRDRVATLPPLPVTGNALLEHATRTSERGAPVDVVHGTKHLVPIRSGALRVLTVHDLLPFERPQDYGLVKRSLIRGPYRLSIARSNVLVCNSRATRDRLAARFPDAEPRAATVPLAAATGLLAAEARPVPELSGRRFALVVGDDSYRKNLGLVVDAWPQVMRHDPTLALVVVGPPSWAGSDRGAKFDRLRDEGHVVALGRVPDEELRWCYENTAVTLCPSMLEGYGLPAAEALAFASPLITSTDAALVEASGAHATHIASDQPEAWAEAIVTVARAGRTGNVQQTRSWDEVADETVAAVRSFHR